MGKDKEIEIIIEKDGSVTIEGINFEGKGCHEAIDHYLKKLGVAKSQKRKADFYQGGKQSISDLDKIGG